MSSLRRKKDERLYRRIVLQEKCIAIVLRKEPKEESYKVGVVRGLPSPTKETNAKDFAYEGGFLVFQDFQRENQGCYWNQKHVDAITQIEYKGFLLPSTLLISGSDYCLEVIRSAWSRRVLRPPPGYAIKRFGDVSALDMTVLPQIHFTPLSEALCLVVGQLNSERKVAAIPSVKKYLLSNFPDMYVPTAESLHKALGTLIKERKLYHTGEGYFVVTPHTYRVRTTSPPSPERQMLMTNDEAIEMLHGISRSPEPFCTRAIQTNLKDIAIGGGIHDRTITPSTIYQESDQDSCTKPSKMERSLSLRILRGKENRNDTSSTMLSRSNSCKISPEKVRSFLENINLKSNPAHKTVDKGEKVSVFTRLFRRASIRRMTGRSKSPAGTKTTFSAQFPPVEWSDPHYAYFHSRGTQTLSRDTKERSRSLSREKKREKSLSLEARPRRNSSEEPSQRSSPRHYSSRSSTLPRKPYANNVSATYDSTTVPEGDSTNCSSLKSHSLPSSSLNSPKMSPRMKRYENSPNRSPAKARSNRSTMERKTYRLNNALRSTDEQTSNINNVVHGYRPTPFSSVRPEDKRPVNHQSVKRSSPKTVQGHVDKQIFNHKTNREPANLKTNQLKDQKSPNDDVLDFKMEFKSRAAQKILQGISDSVDTLADLNNCENDGGVMVPSTISSGTNAKSKGIWEWDSTYLNNSKNNRNQINNSSESILNSLEQKLCSSKSAYCMAHEKYPSLVPGKMKSISAGNTPLFETAA